MNTLFGIQSEAVGYITVCMRYVCEGRRVMVADWEEEIKLFSSIKITEQITDYSLC